MAEQPPSSEELDALIPCQLSGDTVPTALPSAAKSGEHKMESEGSDPEPRDNQITDTAGEEVRKVSADADCAAVRTAIAAELGEDPRSGRIIEELYREHYGYLMRLAAQVVKDVATAEEVTQEAFLALDPRVLRDPENALAYLRQCVINKSRSVMRRRIVAEKNMPKQPPDMPSAEDGAVALVERSAVVDALRKLPAKQREAIVLRFYADMSEVQIATTMGISRGAVKSHSARGMAALRTVLGPLFNLDV